MIIRPGPYSSITVQDKKPGFPTAIFGNDGVCGLLATLKVYVMSRTLLVPSICFLLMVSAGQRHRDREFDGARAGSQRTVHGVNLCWGPPGKFTMGSPVNDPERR